MNKKSNLVCGLISLIPIIVLCFLYNRLSSFVNTNSSGEHGMIVSKVTFIYVIIALSLIWYYLSIFFFQKLINSNFGVSNNGFRILINLFLSIISVVLILSNI